jgi:hypothetical protein
MRSDKVGFASYSGEPTDRLTQSSESCNIDSSPLEPTRGNRAIAHWVSSSHESVEIEGEFGHKMTGY